VGGVSCAFDLAVDDDLRCVDILPLRRSSVFPLSLVEGWVAEGGGPVEVVPVGYVVGLGEGGRERIWWVVGGQEEQGWDWKSLRIVRGVGGEG